jgi:hypothetical protein
MTNKLEFPYKSSAVFTMGITRELVPPKMEAVKTNQKILREEKLLVDVDKQWEPKQSSTVASTPVVQAVPNIQVTKSMLQLKGIAEGPFLTVSGHKL